MKFFRTGWLLSLAAAAYLSPLFAQTEMVKNGTFSGGTTNWTLNKNGGSSSGSVVNNEYQIVVTTAGTEHWHVQFIQTALSLVQGKSYTFSFDAYKGTQNSGTQSMQVNIGKSSSPYTSYFGSQNNMVTLTTSKTRYTYPITMTSASDQSARIEFNCGKSTGGFYLDNVSLIEQTAAVPLLAATPLNVNFGSVGAGQSSVVNVTLQNSGSAPATISNVQVSSIAFTRSISLPATVPAAGTLVLPLTFTPAAAGSYSGTVTILSNASNNPSLPITVSGTGVVSGIAVAPASLLFTAAPASASVQTLTFTNTNSQPVTWSLNSSVSWASPIPASGTVPANGSSTFQVTVTVPSSGNFSGNLSFSHSATNVPSPIIIPVYATISSGYLPTSPYIRQPDKAVQFIKDIAAFRKKARDNVNGGFYTNIDRQGNGTTTNEKSFCGQSRIAYAFVRAFMVSGDESYLELARHALKFLYQHGYNNGWYLVSDLQGNYVSHWGHNDWWNFQQHYALVGVAPMVEATGGTINWNDGVESDHTWLMRGVNHNYTKLWDSNLSTKGYFDRANTAWTSKWGKGFHATVDGITTHALMMSLMYDSTNHETRFSELADNIVDHLIAGMHSSAAGFPEVYNSNWTVDNSVTSMDIGHGFKTAWVLQRAYLLHPERTDYRIAAEELMQNLWDNDCYDEVNGGPFSYLNWQTGEVTGKNKDFWMIEQGFTSGIISYYTAGNQALRDRSMLIADGSLNFFMNKMIDPVYGESYNVVSTDGSTVVDANKGGTFTAGYHSSELGYYTYLYSSLYYHKTPVDLYYSYPVANTERSFRLTPLAIEDDVLKITAITLDGEPYSDFDSDTRLVRLPPGVGGKLKVTFSVAPAVSYSVNATAGSGGSITPSGLVSVNEGGTASFTVTPAAGYRIADILLDGVSIGAVSSYTLSNVTANHTITASFVAIPTFTVTATALQGGTISPAGAVIVMEGNNQSFSVTPATGYRIADVLLDGVSVGAVSSYTLSNVSENHTIAASFVAIPTFTITATASQGGTISPAGAVTVTEGNNQSFSVTPATGYRIADVLLDGVSVGAVPSYTLSNVTANHTIAASFVAIPTFTITATASQGGTISPAGAVTVSEGNNQPFSFTATAGYQLSSVTIDGTPVAAASSYTFSNVSVNHTIEVSFALKTYTITASAGSGGTISPAGTITVQHGGSSAFTITPSSGYQIASVTVDGSSAGSVSSYAFSNITASHTINATFSIISSTVYQINCGSSSAVSPFTGDQYGSGGTSRTITNAITLTGVVNPAPQAVYQSERYGNTTYTIPGLGAGAAYLIRLHFAELYQTASGKRVFNISVNGTVAISNLDIYAAAGARYKALVREVTADANSSGQLIIALTTVTDNATISGIEIIQSTPNAAPTIVTPATATPASVNGTTTSLSALATDDNGESSLSYTWATTGTVPASVSFGSNGTNAAKSTTATFTKAGTYQFTVTAKDAGNKTATSSVSVTVNQTPTSMIITPASASVTTGATQQFSAAVRDQFTTNLSSQPSITWNVTGTGSISAGGLYSAGSITGTATVSATSGTLSANANVTVSSQPSISYRINCGSSSAVAPFTGDQYGSGGTSRTITNAITLTGAVNPAPQAVYQSERYGNSTYTFPNLTAGATYVVRLHFAELYQTASGKRVFNVGVNGTTRLPNFDIYAAAGARYKAVTREFTATANASGQMIITLTTVTDNATIEGIEIISQ